MFVVLLFIYKSPWCFLPSFKSIGLLGQEKRKTDFQDLAWTSDHNDFSYIWSTSHPIASYRVSSQMTLRFRRYEKIDGHLGFPIVMILAIEANCWHRMTNDARRAGDDGHWPITTAHHEHFVFRWADNVCWVKMSRSHWITFPTLQDNRDWHRM